MKKTALVIILFFAFISSALSYSVRASTDKRSYLRYDIVTIYASFRIPKKQGLLNKKTDWAPLKESAECSAKIFHRNRLVKTVGNVDKLSLKYNPALDRWIAKWPIPWNPKLGDYKALIVLRINKKKYAANIEFTVRKRTPRKLPKGFCVMNIEPGDSIIKRVPGVGGKNVKIWENYILWSKFMGASALWHCVGQSQIWNKINPMVFPWDKTALRQVTDLGKTCHKYNMKYGTWITSYVVLGNRTDLSPYMQTIAYDKSTGRLKKLKYVSIYDQKRQADIIKLLRKMDANPYVDYLGLDYVRTDFGGYEYAAPFVRDMPLKGVPQDWDELENLEKMQWLATKIDVEKDKDIQEMWNWWRAHKMSHIIREIIIKSKIKKPLWVFSLTWRQGKEHGQDPLMFIDAGVDINAAMFYSIDKKTYPYLLDDWKDYLRRGNTNLLAGQCVDWNLLGRTYDPAGPEEHYIRQQMAVDRFLKYNPDLGLFWHDLTRAFMHSRGPYSAIEWAISGAASFSYLRKQQHLFPFEVEWDCPDRVNKGEIFTVEINIKNNSAITMDFYIKLLKITNLEMFGDIVQKFYLAPGEIKTLAFQVKAMEKNYKKSNMQMVAFMLQYHGITTQQRYFDFKYIQVK